MAKSQLIPTPQQTRAKDVCQPNFIKRLPHRFRDFFYINDKMLSYFQAPLELSSAPFSLPKNIEMLGGEWGRPPTLRELDRIAALMHNQWGPKEPGRTWHDYRRELGQRVRNIKTPIFVANDEGGKIVAAVFPISLGHIPESWMELTASRTYKNDTLRGKFIFCPQIVSISAGMASHLITEGVLPYAKWRHSLDSEVELIAYSRMSQAKKHMAKLGLEKPVPRELLFTLVTLDSTYAGFHHANGAELAFILRHGSAWEGDPLSGGAIFGMRYTHLLPEKPQERRLGEAVLLKYMDACRFGCEIQKGTSDGRDILYLIN